MVEWLTSDPVRALMVAVITVIGGSYLPLQKILKTLVPGLNTLPTTTPIPSTDSHVALSKLIDVIQVVRLHGDTKTADALGALMPQVVIACCAPEAEEINAT